MYPVFTLIIRIAGLGSIFPLQLIIEEVIIKHVKYMWWMISTTTEYGVETYCSVTLDQRDITWFKLHWDDT